MAKCNYLPTCGLQAYDHYGDTGVDAKKKRKIIRELQGRVDDGRSRLILRPARTKQRGDKEVLSPKSYDSRVEFRKALIEHRRRAGDKALRELTVGMEMLDLKVAPAPLMQAVVVEGSVEALVKALDHPEVDDAVADFTIELTLADEDPSP